MALLVARRTNDRKVAGSRPTKVVCITVLTGNRLGWTVCCGRPTLLLPSCRKLEFRLSALMDSDLAWVNGNSGRQSWRYADAFQCSIISEAIYHFILLHRHCTFQQATKFWRCKSLAYAVPLEKVALLMHTDKNQTMCTDQFITDHLSQAAATVSLSTAIACSPQCFWDPYSACESPSQQYVSKSHKHNCKWLFQCQGKPAVNIGKLQHDRSLCFVSKHKKSGKADEIVSFSTSQTQSVARHHISQSLWPHGYMLNDDKE